MPWEITENNIRSGHRSPEEFQKDTLKTITLDEKEGVKAVIGKPKGKDAMEIQSYLFEKDKGWTLEKAKEWFKKHHTKAKEHVYAVLPFTITEKMLEKPLRLRGVAMTAGMSRNFNIYTPEELQAFAGKLCGAEMLPYAPDLALNTYGFDDRRDLAVLMVCTLHFPMFFSTRKPVEVIYT